MLKKRGKYMKELTNRMIWVMTLKMKSMDPYIKIKKLSRETKKVLLMIMNQPSNQHGKRHGELHR